MIIDNIIFKNRLDRYFNGEFNLNSEPMTSLVPNIMICDDYKSKSKIKTFNNVKFRIEPEGPQSFTVHQIGVYDDKIINITHKMLSYFTLVNDNWTYGHNQINKIYNELKKSSNVEEIDEEVFQFFDCFPYAPVHNLDDTYNLLYTYISNGLKCKLLVLKTDNFYYNQTLNSLKEHFNLEYIYLDFNKNYKFKKFNCVRQYHWIQNDSLNFIHENYIKKICDKYKGKPTYDNICLIKTIHQTNASVVDTFTFTDKFNNILKEKNIFNLDNLRDDLEYKIYVTNNAKNIIASYLSPFSVNIHKHCYITNNKNFIILNGGYGGPITPHFINLSDTKHDFYGVKINGVVINDKISLNDLDKYINF
jgi:hypothetical protein